MNKLAFWGILAILIFAMLSPADGRFFSLRLSIRPALTEKAEKKIATTGELAEAVEATKSSDPSKAQYEICNGNPLTMRSEAVEAPAWMLADGTTGCRLKRGLLCHVAELLEAAQQATLPFEVLIAECQAEKFLQFQVRGSGKIFLQRNILSFNLKKTKSTSYPGFWEANW